MADLLGEEMATGIIGFDAVSRGMEGRDREGGSMEEVLHGTGMKFQTVMKQLGKRDPTTKIKVPQHSNNHCICVYIHVL